MEEKIIQIRNTAEPVEEKREDFSKSIFEGVYEKMDEILQSIVHVPEKNKGDVIAVIGNRGSGKSSVMKSYTKSKRQISEKDDVEYNVLECIDASLLDTQEDIFDIILTKMLKNIDEKIDRAKKSGENTEITRLEYQEILQKFNHVFESHQAIKRQSLEYEQQGYSSLAVLRKFKDSVDLTESFEKLVEDYMWMMSGKKDRYLYKSKKRYLIISVDDLDMNVDNGFKGLEQLYRYIAVRNVILFITVKYEQVEYLAEKKGYRLFPDINRELEIEKTEYIENYARDYLEKMLPIQNRVYMPDIVNRFLNYRTIWKVDTDLADSKELVDIKTSLYRRIYKKTGMCFYISGKKPYILEPESLREMNGYFNLLDSMQPDEMRKQWNCERFIEDFFDRVMVEKLSRKYQKEFLLLSRIGFSNVYNEIEKFLREEHENGRGIREFSTSHEFKSGYGELLHDLATFSGDGEGERYFGHAILILFTYAVQKEIRRAESEIDTILQNSWAGSWSNQLVPSLSDIINEDVNVGNRLNLNYLVRNWGCMEEIPMPYDRDSGKETPIILTYDVYRINNGKIEEWIDDNKEIISYLEVIFMFFEKFYNKEHTIEDLKLVFDENRIYIKNERFDFNILAFIKNSFYYEKYFNQLYRSMAKGLTGIFEEDEDDIVELLKENSVLLKKYIEWGSENKYVLPVQYTDVYYHMLKYTQMKNKERAEDMIHAEKTWDEVVRVFQCFEEFLEKQDKGYKVTSMKKCFTECPFVKYIYEQGDTWEKDTFGKMIVNFAREAISNKRMMLNDLSLQKYNK